MEELFEIAALGELNHNALEEAILQEVMKERKSIFIRSSKYGKLNLDKLTEKEFLSNFRFKKNDILRVADGLGLPDKIAIPNRYSVGKVEGLCIYLRRLTYPNRLADLEALFGFSAQSLSIIANDVMTRIRNNRGHLLNNLDNLNWLNQRRMHEYAESVANVGAPLKNCWGFIDGTARAICRPTLNQEEYYSGHKRHHCVKYQSVICPDGIIASLMGPYPGRRHDAGIFRASNLYTQLENKAIFGPNKKYVLYGDPAYPIQELILCPFPGKNLTAAQQNFNSRMSTVRQAVEWGFGKILNEFAFLDFKKNQKLLLQDIGSMYITGTIITNCHTCLYGSQAGQFFNMNPPTLEEYLGF